MNSLWKGEVRMAISSSSNLGGLSTGRSGSQDKLSDFRTQIDGLKKSIESIKRGRFNRYN